VHGTHTYIYFWVGEHARYVNLCTYSVHNNYIVIRLALRWPWACCNELPPAAAHCSEWDGCSTLVINTATVNKLTKIHTLHPSICNLILPLYLYSTFSLITVIELSSKCWKRHSKAKCRAPAYSRAPRSVSVRVQKEDNSYLNLDINSLLKAVTPTILKVLDIF